MLSSSFEIILTNQDILNHFDQRIAELEWKLERAMHDYDPDNIYMINLNIRDNNMWREFFLRRMLQ